MFTRVMSEVVVNLLVHPRGATRTSNRFDFHPTVRLIAACYSKYVIRCKMQDSVNSCTSEKPVKNGQNSLCLPGLTRTGCSCSSLGPVSGPDGTSQLPDNITKPSIVGACFIPVESGLVTVNVGNPVNSLQYRIT